MREYCVGFKPAVHYYCIINE